MPKRKTDKELKSRYRSVKVAGKKVDEHRYVASCILGRPLRSDEVVHHKDGNKLNNDPSNLEIMSATAHKKLHATTNNFSRLTKEDRSRCSKAMWENGCCDSKKRAVIAFSKHTGEVVARYESTKEAERHGYNGSHVSACCLGKRKSSSGLIWRYAQDCQEAAI